MANKSTNAEIELRISTISEMVVKGYTRDKIIRYASAEWKVSERTTDTYLKKAWDKIHKSTNYDLKQEVTLQRARFEDLYSKNYNIQDYRECRQVLDSLAKLLGVNKPDQHEIDTNNKHSFEVTPEIVDKVFKAYEDEWE